MTARTGITGPDFSLVVADGTTELALIDTYETASFIARHNQVSTWEITLPSVTEAARLFIGATRPRLIVYARGEIWRSGPVIRFERVMDTDGDMLTVAGVDDMIWLRRRLAHPQPAKTAPPYDGQAYDVRTGNAAQVIAAYIDANAGPAAVPARQVPGLTVPVPAPAGGSGTWRARYQNLFDFIAPIARNRSLTVEIRGLDVAITAATPVRAFFSVDLGTLAGWSSGIEAPELNYVYVAGAGTGTARLIREYSNGSSVSQWMRMEGFEDRRDTSVTAELDEAGAEALADADISATVEMTTLDTVSQSFLTDWKLGDTAVATIGGVTVTEVIAEVNVALEPNAPPTVTPVLGGPAVNLRTWRRLNNNEQRIRQLERV